ncbi:cation diffusion facilitator CzcD-associated flavoprotein CzcO [Pseudaminobacter salicylatoxidans]|uniref:Cation diffusion facilitator CzcD-associated flavoprotein CzcO n=1 Tax=Pseudaminobacter salicylatoxidans TaxID=93369 RepID=A0A316BXV4_PSESE|nr:NAD(P)/FAD-dependent oxidoreductase [Pseudaminobacter salicylatoxidans]PWJ78435.1 cation diffusion facilitator CzcD-associated flavoprotein CzcO [Pseudaminobacter salicylatoxidans]
MSSTDAERVIVIGAGAAGMASAHALREQGLPAVILEQEARIGEPWRRRHGNLTLNTHRDLSAMPGTSFPKGTPAFPHRDQLVAHLTAFGEGQNLPIEYGIRVDAISRADKLWTVHANGHAWTARDVVVATGRDKHPYMPQWKGAETFGGRLIHAADFGEAAAHAGKSVLVIGAGNSGFDLLNHLIRVQTGQLWLAARNGPAILPKRIAKVAVHKFSPITASLPNRLADFVVATTQRLIWGDMTRYGLPKAPGGGVSRLRSDYTAIAADDGAMNAIKAGRIKVVPTVHAFHTDGTVVLSDGQTVQPDVTIAATGYRTGLEGLVGAFGVLDEKGFPLVNGADHPDAPGLWFLGMRPSIRGCFRESVRQADSIARAILRNRRR